MCGMSSAETTAAAGSEDALVLLDLRRTVSLGIARLSEEKERAPCLAESRDSSSSSMMWATRRRVALDVLLVCWGLGTWLGVNGLFVELPVLIAVLPEGWTLPSAMVLAVQSANIGLLIYASLRNFSRISDTHCIYGLLTIGTIALFLNSFLYSKTVYLGGTERSVAFLALTFFVALVGCTSSVLFYPYLRHYRDMYLATYLIGEGLGGFTPSVLALIQGVGGEVECVLKPDNSSYIAVRPPPLFDSTVYITLLGLLSTISLISFCILHNYPGFASERVKEGAVAKEDEAAPRESLLQPQWVGVMVLVLVLNAVNNGIMPSVQSYSCMPYGKRAYHLAATLGSMANPMACLAGVWLRPLAGRFLAPLLGLSAALFGYILLTAVQSPNPPLAGSKEGAVIVICCWVLCSGLVSYGRMWVYGWSRRGGARGMRVCGALGQVGSALGSLTFYALINYTTFFQQTPDCPAQTI
ncbi:solute carrier family 52, riboflavin transporter, member 3-A isoform X1 [Pieris rapae]|uniref:solute carrier family 52, riboflavin transporter, member 3-A isoform X1 n=1 Tax=Pieris rapae TaxID=64459 RepID=UPI001E27E3A4|nr:solute carrier family 52, riboflavin transporter, member 3-A isoform X1 [Pieris rapae]